MPKANIVEIAPGRNFTFADWHNRAEALRLKRCGKSLVGPCPACGGTDRFSVEERSGKALFQCRGCDPNGRSQAGLDAFKKILQEAGLASTGDRATNGRRRRQTARKTPLETATPAGSHEDPFQRKDAATLGTILARSKIELRWNLRAQKIDYREPETEAAPGAWRSVDDLLMARVRDDLSRSYYVATERGPRALHFGRERWEDSVNALIYRNQVDPFAEWLEALPGWDGVPVLAPLLTNLFGADDDALSHWAGRYLFLGAVERTYKPGCKLDEIPVLVGAQGTGKSALLKSMVPPEMPELFSDGLRFDAFPEKQVEATRGRAIVEVSEMAGRSRTDIEAMKAFVSRQDDGHVRRPYARHAEPQPRRFIMAGTTNIETDLPNDPSGNRRFVPVNLGAATSRVEDHIDVVRCAAWAEALHLFYLGETAALPRELIPMQKERAEEHRDRDDLIEDAILAFPDVALTLSEVVDLLPERVRSMSEHRIGRALKNAGWSSERVRRGEGNRVRIWTSG